MITSTKNDQVKAVIELKKKARARNEQGLFVVEGVRMAAELPKDQVKSIYLKLSRKIRRMPQFLRSTRDTNLSATLCLR